MLIWLLEAKNLKNDTSVVDPWDPWFDKVFSFVVEAKTEREARDLAAEDAGDEGDDAWLLEKYSTCTEIGLSKAYAEERIVVRDFAGT